MMRTTMCWRPNVRRQRHRRHAGWEGDQVPPAVRHRDVRRRHVAGIVRRHARVARRARVTVLGRPVVREHASAVGAKVVVHGRDGAVGGDVLLANDAPRGRVDVLARPVPALVELGHEPRLDRRVHPRDRRGGRVGFCVTGIGLVDDGLAVVVLMPVGIFGLPVLGVERAPLHDLSPLVAALGVAHGPRRPVRGRGHRRAAVRRRNRRRGAHVLADRIGGRRRIVGERRRAQRE